MSIATINPSNGEIIKIFSPFSDSEVDEKLSLAEKAFKEYCKTSLAQRGSWIKEAARILTEKKQEFARMITLEMGKTYTSAIAEIEKCVFNCQFYSEHAEEFLSNISVITEAKKSYIQLQPLGPLLAIMPWNFPFWQVFRFAVPSLLAGNVILLKHASNVPQCALAIEEIFREAGFPEGILQTLLIESDKVEDIIKDKRIKAVTFTGSTSAGAKVASIAGKEIKKVVLELGGSDPFIVMETANFEDALMSGINARIINNGQSCIAAKRFLIVDQVYERFANGMRDKFKALKIGDPMSSDTDLGPLASSEVLKILDYQVKMCEKMGAKILIGGYPLTDRPGNFYMPTIITDLPPGTPADDEEFFGPVALLYRVKDTEEAIHIANKTPYGLGASVWTNDEKEIERFISELECGMVFINGIVKSDPRLPFGGIKYSGYGRELGIQGIFEFCNLKTVYIK